MKRFYFLAFILMAVYTNVAADAPVIQLNTTGQLPLNSPSQHGFMDEVAAEVFHRIGYQLETVRLPAERGLRNADHGIVDGEMSRVKGIDRIYKNLIQVPEKIMDWNFVAFSYKQDSLDRGWADLSGKSVAHINGWKILEKNIPASAEVTKTSNAENLFNLLRRQRTDYVLYEQWGGRYLLEKMAMKDVGLCKTPLAVKEMYIYLHRKHKDLVPKLAIALADMKKDGSYQELVKKHLLPYK